MATLRLSDLKPEDVQVEQPATGALKLSQLDPSEVGVEGAPPAPAAPEVSQLESGLRGLGQGATFGYGDEVEGAAKALYDFATNPNTTLEHFTDAYRKHRDEARQANEAAKEANPWTYNLSQGAGMAASSLFPVVGGEAGLAKLAAMGAASGLGDSNADLTKGDVGQAALDTGIGAAGGLAGGVVGKVGSKALDALAPDALKAFAEQRAVKALNPNLSQQEMLEKRGAVQALGRELLDTGAVGFGDSVDNIAPKVADQLSQKGQRIGAIRQEVSDATGPIDIGDLARKGDAYQAFTSNSIPAEQAVAKEYGAATNAINNTPERSLTNVQDLIGTINDHIPFEKDPGKLTAEQKALKELRADLVGKVDDRITEYSPELAAEHGALKQQFGLLKQGDQILDKSTARAARNRSFSPSDYAAAIMESRNGEGGFGGGLKGIAAGLVNKVARERGNSALAVGADKLSNVLSMAPERLGKFAGVLKAAAQKGNNSLAVANYLLMQRDPEYRQTVNGLGDE